MLRSSHRVVFALVSLLVVGSWCQASWYNPVSWFKKDKSYETLIVTGNYVDSRLLAELIQRQKHHPILLLPSGNETDTLFFLGPNGKAVKLDKDNYLWLVNYIEPKTILFLGDEHFAPTEYSQQVKDKYAILAYDSKDWSNIAVSCGELFGIKHLAGDFSQLRSRIDDDGKIKGPKNVEALWKGGEKTDEVPAAEATAVSAVATDLKK